MVIYSDGHQSNNHGQNYYQGFQSDKRVHESSDRFNHPSYNRDDNRNRDQYNHQYYSYNHASASASTSTSASAYNAIPQKKEHQVKHKHNRYKYVIRFFHFCSFVTIGILGYYTIRTQLTLERTLSKLSSTTSDYSILQDAATKLDTELSHMHDLYDMMTEEMMSLSKEKEHKDTLMTLQREIQDIDRRDLERRYGKGPYKVKMTLIIDRQEFHLIIETAPNNIMPHSVRVFMDMVENRAWENTRFLHPPHDIIISSDKDDPITGRPQNDHLTKTLLFPEYSHEFPHVFGTLGFGGRPGGPNFYINMNDNRDIHGPGGQSTHDLMEEADSCFGIITSGRDTIQAIIERVDRRHLDCIISRIEILPRIGEKVQVREEEERQEVPVRGMQQLEI